MEIPCDVISASVRKFSRMSGFGESTVWKLIHDGDLETVAIGRRRLVFDRFLPTANREAATRRSADACFF
jgi:hypothetical protein